ncbi:hypothetical protein ElyMa_003051300 [Elysia marginata]|uniref:Uncharacterized protein n=1 Tax=Elysia marginata TaxID=1093978 RepID=A0AAV4IL05_9GAST|nr:hypothetical protein ElyMa_003051300 [Elysia marginata]
MVGLVQPSNDEANNRAVTKKEKSNMKNTTSKDNNPNGSKTAIRRHGGKVKTSPRNFSVYHKIDEHGANNGNRGSPSRLDLSGVETNFDDTSEDGRPRKVSIGETVIKELNTVQNLSLKYYRPVTPRTLDQVMFLKGM